MSPVHPTISCSWECDNERMPEIIAACPWRGANDQTEDGVSPLTCSVVERSFSLEENGPEPGTSVGLEGGVAGGLSTPMTFVVWFARSVAVMGR